MAKIQALEWIFSSPAVFLMTMTFISMISCFAALKQLRASVLVAILTLMYGSYSQETYVTGLVYVLVVMIALLLANQLYDMIIGSSSGGESI